MLTTLTLIGLLSATTPAVPGNLSSPPSEVVRQSDLQALMAKDGHFWIGYSVPPVPDKGNLCCWSGWENGRQTKAQGCSLDQSKNNGFGSVADSPEMTSLQVFIEINDGDVERIMPVGEHCPVDTAGETLVWIEDFDGRQSMQFLTRTIDQGSRKIADQALHAVALHQEPAATNELYTLANGSQGKKLARSAVFWLGEARGKPGFDRLQQLLNDLDPGELRKQINFALHVSDEPEADELLVQISQQDSDQRQRGDALFWLAQGNHPEAMQLLTDAINNETSKQARDQAIHGLASLEDEAAADRLVSISETHRDAHTRSQALFWLTQNYPDRALPILLKLVESSAGRQSLENAVFNISQLPEEIAGPTLLKLIHGSYSTQVKKQALFWLAQTGDQETLDELYQLLDGGGV